ncbi:DUF6088 family protein [Caenibius sp. WL]|uniref:DUF6088 family protein n=1 Tax=Caenibius sp. WL TaxID=2872646 RepID=UPI001C993182|nr:DUF6088 family protein [Caenibius sp. WL]QZP09132.1 DUF6088 family protein [Caenibius sp. WL]
MRGPTTDLKAQILDRVTATPAVVWTPIDFLDLGVRAAVDKVLQRLAKNDSIARLDRGLYYLPQKDSLTGRIGMPDIRAVIDAVGRRDQARLLIDEATAANDLGFTTAAPSQVVVLTDARLRSIHLGNQAIRFKQAAPSKLFWAGRPAMRIVQALHWLQDMIQAGQAREATNRLRELVRGQALREDLRDGLPTLPIWMQNYLRGMLDETDPALPLPLAKPSPRSLADARQRQPIGSARTKRSD